MPTDKQTIAAQMIADFERLINPEKSIHRHAMSAWIKAIESLPQPKGGVWIIFKCPTCEKHYGKNYVHLDIVSPCYFDDRDEENYPTLYKK